jgi:hypothetical protein
MSKKFALKSWRDLIWIAPYKVRGYIGNQISEPCKGSISDNW